MGILTSQLPKKEKEFWRNICNYTRKPFFFYSNKIKEPTKKKKIALQSGYPVENICYLNGLSSS